MLYAPFVHVAKCLQPPFTLHFGISTFLMFLIFEPEHKQTQIYLYHPTLAWFCKTCSAFTSWARCGLQLHCTCFNMFQHLCDFLLPVVLRDASSLFRLLMSLQRFLEVTWGDTKKLLQKILRQIYAQKSVVGSSGSSGSVVSPLVTAMTHHAAKSALTYCLNCLNVSPQFWSVKTLDLDQKTSAVSSVSSVHKLHW